MKHYLFTLFLTFTLAPLISFAQTRVFDETLILSDSEKIQIEDALKKLPGRNQVHLAQNFDGKEPLQYVSETYQDALFGGVEGFGTDGLMIAYNVQDNSFFILSGTKWTHQIEADENQSIINEILMPAFSEKNYAEGLLEAIARIGQIYKENSTFRMSDDLKDRTLVFADETGNFSRSLGTEITELLESQGVNDDEHVIYVRISSFDPLEYNQKFGRNHQNQLSAYYNISEDMYYQYSREIHKHLFTYEEYSNLYQTTEETRPYMTLVCIYGDELYLLSNWEKFIEVESSIGQSHTRTLANHLGDMYKDYAGVGSEEAGIKRIVEKVVQLSRREIEATRNLNRPSMLSLAWFNHMGRAAITIFVMLVVLGFVVWIVFKLRKRSE